MNFKKGEQILCIESSVNHYFETEAEVTVGVIYTCIYTFAMRDGVFVRIWDDSGLDRCYLAHKFITVDDAKNVKNLRTSILKNRLKHLISK